MLKKPNLTSLKLWELAKEWNKKFTDCDLSVDDILRYGINGDLTIYAEIPQSCEIEEAIYMDMEDFKKTYPNKFEKLSPLRQIETKIATNIKKHKGGLEPLQKKYLQIIYLEGAVKLIELQDPHNPNKVLRNTKFSIEGPFEEIIHEHLPKLTKKNLCVLLGDIIAFEEEYFLSKASKNTIDEANAISTSTNHAIKETSVHNKTDHNSFAPELAIACEIWNYLYVENKIKKGKNIKSQVAAWLKNNKDKYAKYFLHTKDKDFPSQELCKRLSTVITPQARKGGGIESIE